MGIDIRMQIACIFVLLCVGYANTVTKRLTTISSYIYKHMYITAIINIVFDMMSVYTVNHIDTVHPILNHLVHIVFIFTLNYEVFLLYQYIISYTQNVSKISKLLKRIQMIPIILSGFIVLFGKMEYVITPKGNYSSGIVPNSIYISIAFYLFWAIFYNIKYWKDINALKRNAVLQSIVIVIVFSCVQLLYPISLASSLGVTMVMLSIFLSMENPGEYIEKETGIFNQHAFQRIIKEKFQLESTFTIVTVLSSDWDMVSAKHDQELQASAIIKVSEFVAKNFKVDIYHVMESSLCMILPDGKGVGRMIDLLERRFKEPFTIRQQQVILNMNIRRIVCPNEAVEEAEVMAAIGGFVNETAKKLAYYDTLTGVKNRNGYEKEARLLFEKRGNTKSVSCIMVDINDLKSCNDTLGHGKGDELIQSTANILVEATGAKSDVYRIGGDEFVIMLKNLSSKELKQLIQKIEVCRQSYNNNRPRDRVHVAFALGYSNIVDFKHDTFSDLIKQADQMMYENKKIMKTIRFQDGEERM